MTILTGFPRESGRNESGSGFRIEKAGTPDDETTKGSHQSKGTTTVLIEMSCGLGKTNIVLVNCFQRTDRNFTLELLSRMFDRPDDMIGNFGTNGRERSRKCEMTNAMNTTFGHRGLTSNGKMDTITKGSHGKSSLKREPLNVGNEKFIKRKIP
jgi:hypothetical protein